jgi:hypothetical protein
MGRGRDKRKRLKTKNLIRSGAVVPDASKQKRWNESYRIRVEACLESQEAFDQMLEEEQE